MQFFGRQERVDVTVTKAGKELQMPRLLRGSTNDKQQVHVKKIIVIVAHKG